MINTINNQSHERFIEIKQPSKTQVYTFAEHIPAQAGNATLSWNERAIRWLKDLNCQLEQLIPNFPIQNKIDELARSLKSYFAPLKEFNKRLDDNGNGAWYTQLATFLWKLPLRAIRNIVRLLYSIIKTALYAAVHPLKAVNKLARLLVKLAHALTKPDTWSKMGAGMIGASVGHSLVSGNPLSVIATGIGAAMVIGGLTAGAIQAALGNQEDRRLEAVKEQLLAQAKDLPESALTGFLMGLITGGIQRAVQNAHQTQNNTIQHQASSPDTYVQQYLTDNNLPASTQWEFDPAQGKLTLNIPVDPQFARADIDMFYRFEWKHWSGWYERIQVEVFPTETQATVYGMDRMLVDNVLYKSPFSHPIAVAKIVPNPISANIFRNTVPNLIPEETVVIPGTLPFQVTNLLPIGTAAGAATTLVQPSRTIATDFAKVGETLAGLWQKVQAAFPIRINVNVSVQIGT